MGSMKERAWEKALAQLALDYNAQPENFLSEGNVIVSMAELPGRRKYREKPPLFQMATTGQGVVISAHPSLHQELEQWVGDSQGHRLFEYSKLTELDGILAPHGWKVSGVFHMFLPKREFTAVSLPRGFSFPWYDGETVKSLYPNRLFPNAISEQENPLRPDVIAVGAMDRNELVALAGASADGEELWQVGIDVLPGYRGKGLGKALVSALCAGIAQQGKVPFYGTAPANLHSQNIAVGCGFFPAWVEVTTQPIEEPVEIEGESV